MSRATCWLHDDVLILNAIGPLDIAPSWKDIFDYFWSFAWIILARRMESSILELTTGEGLISSLAKRTAAIIEAAIRIALFAVFAS